MISLPGERPKERAPDQIHAEENTRNPDASLKPVRAPLSVFPAGSRQQAVTATNS